MWGVAIGKVNLALFRNILGLVFIKGSWFITTGRHLFNFKRFNVERINSTFFPCHTLLLVPQSTDNVNLVINQCGRVKVGARKYVLWLPVDIKGCGLIISACLHYHVVVNHKIGIVRVFVLAPDENKRAPAI